MTFCREIGVLQNISNSFSILNVFLVKKYNLKIFVKKISINPQNFITIFFKSL